MAEARNAMRAVVSDARALPSCKENDAYVPDDTAVGACLAAGL